MLIIEGSDCLGKTTFAKSLLKVADERKLFPTFYSHMSRPNCKFDFFKHYKDIITTYAVQDRFHLGGIVWHHAISQAELEIIEGWLRSVGSMIIVFYASDERWYKERIEKDNRGNLLSIDAMCVANREYKWIVNRSHSERCLFDFSYDIKKSSDECAVYPNIIGAEYAVDKWFERLSLLEKL